jgi:hypothetical protein
MAVAATGRGGVTDSSTTVATTSPSSTCTGSGSAYGGWGQDSEGTTCALKAKRFRGARLSTPVSACLREYRTEVNKQGKVEKFTMETPRTKTYILEHTWDFFARRPDESCSGAARLEPADSGAVPLRSTASTARRCAPPTTRGLILRPPHGRD